MPDQHLLSVLTCVAVLMIGPSSMPYLLVRFGSRFTKALLVPLVCNAFKMLSLVWVCALHTSAVYQALSFAERSSLSLLCFQHIYACQASKQAIGTKAAAAGCRAYSVTALCYRLVELPSQSQCLCISLRTPLAYKVEAAHIKLQISSSRHLLMWVSCTVDLRLCMS